MVAMLQMPLVVTADRMTGLRRFRDRLAPLYRTGCRRPRKRADRKKANQDCGSDDFFHLVCLIRIANSFDPIARYWITNARLAALTGKIADIRFLTLPDIASQYYGRKKLPTRVSNTI